MKKTVFKQGSLDGLCGIYSFVNAVNTLYNFTKDESQDLFERIIQYNRIEKLIFMNL